MSSPQVPDPETKETLRELVQLCNDLQRRVKDLEETVEAYEDLVEVRGVESVDEASMKDVWVADQPVGRLVNNADKRSRKAIDRIEELEAGEVDVGDLIDAGAVDSNLSIQTKLAERRAGQLHERGNDKNLYRATYVWEAFHEHATRDRGRFKVTSKQVQRILEKTEGESFPTDRMTVQRVMKQLAKHTDRDRDCTDPEADSNLVVYDTRQSSNVLTADRDEWKAFFGEQHDELLVQSNETMDQLQDATSEVDADD